MGTDAIETTNAYLNIRSDGILVFRYKDGVTDTLESARENRAASERLVGDRAPVPLLIDFARAKGTTAEAREYYISDAVPIRSRVALLIKSPVSRVLGNVYMGLTQNPVPTKLFTSEEKAVRWLREG